jgi:hypothetical protein
MNHTSHTSSRTHDAQILLALALFCFAGVTGFFPWKQSDPTVGYFRVGTNPYGIAVYQEGPHASLQITKAKTYAIAGKTITIAAPVTGSTTLTYSRDDIIFDSTGMVYTEPTEDQLTMLGSLLGRTLIKTTDLERTVSVNESHLYVVNPHTAGMLKISLPETVRASINRDTKTILTSSATAVQITAHERITL